MLRLRFALAAAAIAAVALASSAAAAPVKLTGTVGPGFTITLKKGSQAVKTLTAGSYTITVTDRSNIHNFRLRGPGVNKEITGIGFKGTKTVTVTLKKGSYTFVCDPHASTMKGTVKVS